MKSLQESLFDTDITSKDTGYEYLYGFIEQASVGSEYYIHYFDESKIKRDFNEVSRTFKPQQWSNNYWTSMARFQHMDNDERLRELLYIVSSKVPGSIVSKKIDLLHAIKDAIKPYVKLHTNEFNALVHVTPSKTRGGIGGEPLIIISFCEKGGGDYPKILGNIRIQLKTI